MQKDPRILGVLQHLEATLGARSFIVSDYWDADLLAVGVTNPAHPGALAYIAIEVATGQFTVIIEGPPKLGSDMPYEEIACFECNDLDDITWLVRDFLRIEPIAKP